MDDLDQQTEYCGFLSWSNDNEEILFQQELDESLPKNCCNIASSVSASNKFSDHEIETVVKETGATKTDAMMALTMNHGCVVDAIIHICFNKPLCFAHSGETNRIRSF
jgi:hypothetical protein